MDEMSLKYLVQKDGKYINTKEEDATHVIVALKDFEEIVHKYELVSEIIRQMICAKQGITPKKERSGYYVRCFHEKVTNCMSDGIPGRQLPGRCWEYEVVTPIPLELGVEDARKIAIEFLDPIFDIRKHFDSRVRAEKEENIYFTSDVYMEAYPYTHIWSLKFIIPNYIPIPEDLYPPEKKKRQKKNASSN